MLKSLFSSRTRIELLKLFLLNPRSDFYLRQIEKKTALPLRAIQREISNLCGIGLLVKRASGNRNYYSLNENHPLRNELKGIVLKTSGIVEALARRLRANKDIELAFIYGSYAKDNENPFSDIDLFVIGDITSRQLSSLLGKEKATLGREVNFNQYSKNDFINRLKDKNHFLLSLLKDKKIFIIGSDDELKAIRAGRSS
jgi:predicted nucleotidyltransferase